MARAGSIEYHVRAILQVDAAGKQSKAMKAFADGLVSAGNRIQSAGKAIMGNTLSIAANILKAGTMMTAGLAATGIVALASKAVALNVELENATFGVASSLQLMARNGGDFTKNMSEASWIMGELEKRSAASPASFEQAQELFRNMLPGAIMLTDNMEQILDMAEAALTLGIQMGGDFRQAGADLRRILTGQAGADVRVWQEGLSKAISDIAAEKGGKLGKAIGGATGDKLTQAFNKLKPEERFQLVEAAVMRLGPATAAAATNWAGLTSTVATLGTWLLRVAGGQAFDRIKARLAQWSDPKGDGLFGSAGKAKMERMARFLGVKLGDIIDRALDGFERVFNYVSDNWESILDTFYKIMRGIKNSVKIAAAVGAGRAVAGAGVAAVGGGMAAAGGAIKAAPQLLELIAMVGGLGMAAAIALPVVALLAIVLGGLGVLAVGAMATFIDKLDDLRELVAQGAIDLTPVYEAIGLLWWRLSEMGAAIFGMQDPVAGTNRLLLMFAGLLDSISGIMAFFLRALWLVQFAFNALTAGLQAVYLGVVGIVYGLFWLVQQAIEAIPGASDIVSLTNPLESMQGHMQKVADSVRTDAREATDTRLLEGADALENYKAGLGEGMKTTIEGAFGRPGAGAATAAGGGEEEDKPKRPRSVTNIAKVVVNQDLRGENPDRVIGHFNKALRQASQRRRSPYTAVAEGM